MKTIETGNEHFPLKFDYIFYGDKDEYPLNEMVNIARDYDWIYFLEPTEVLNETGVGLVAYDIRQLVLKGEKIAAPKYIFAEEADDEEYVSSVMHEYANPGYCESREIPIQANKRYLIAYPKNIKDAEERVTRIAKKYFEKALRGYKDSLITKICLDWYLNPRRAKVEDIKDYFGIEDAEIAEKIKKYPEEEFNRMLDDVEGKTQEEIDEIYVEAFKIIDNPRFDEAKSDIISKARKALGINEFPYTYYEVMDKLGITDDDSLESLLEFKKNMNDIDWYRENGYDDVEDLFNGELIINGVKFY